MVKSWQMYGLPTALAVRDDGDAFDQTKQSINQNDPSSTVVSRLYDCAVMAGS
jgi:hypothetical protein